MDYSNRKPVRLALEGDTGLLPQRATAVRSGLLPTGPFGVKCLHLHATEMSACEGARRHAGPPAVNPLCTETWHVPL
eukprot:332548-Prymnesium_polylepis.2